MILFCVLSFLPVLQSYKMEHYLQQVSEILAKLQEFKSVIVVMGNESGDLDSCISSLSYAYLLYNELHSEAKTTVAVLPLINMLQKELPLRTEVTYFLKKNGIPLDHLVFHDTLDLVKLQNEGRLKLILVDHHVLAPEFAVLRKSVVEIIDHHPQDPAWLWPEQKVILTKVGSCSSLVASEVLKRSPGLVDTQLALLLYGPIILDTACFSPAADRTTPLDLKVAAELENRGINVTKEKLFEDLLAARADVSSLTPSQLLVKDLKIASGIPVPGLPILVKEFVTRPKVGEALHDFCLEKNSSIAVVMGLHIEGDKIERDIAVFHTSAPSDAQELVNCLKSSTEPALELEEVMLDPEYQVPGLQLFSQQNIKASRKQVLPLVRNAGICLVKHCKS